MPVDKPEETAEICDTVRRPLGADQPSGSIFHIAGPSPHGGFRLINVWQSEDDAYRFLNERLKPAFEAVAVPRPPHDRSSGRCTTTRRRRRDHSWPR
jgi:hypothetical protein